jgi:DNA-binding transcriptional ArsR family regulator
LGLILPALDRVLTAISDPTRRAILERLARGPARISDAAAPFEMSLAAVSKHVRVLERAGLVRRVRRGREHTLTLDARPLRQVARWTSRYERFWNERFDRLEAFFAQKGQSK